MPNGKCSSTVHPDSWSEAHSEIFKCGHAHEMSEKRNNNQAESGRKGQNHHAGREKPPVSFIGRSRIRDESDAGDDRCQQGNAHQPSGNVTTSHEIAVRSALTAKKAQPQSKKGGHVDGKDGRIQNAQPDHEMVFSASANVCLDLSRSKFPSKAFGPEDRCIWMPAFHLTF